MVELFGVLIIKSEEVWAQHKDDPEKLASILFEVIKKDVSLSEKEFEELRLEV
jgi:hypothetical protein